MLLILLNFVFNACQLVWIYAFSSVLLGYWIKLPSPTDNMLITLSCATLILVIFLSMSRLCEWLFRLFLNVRNPVSREQAQLELLLQEVLTQANSMKSFNIKVNIISIMKN